MTVFGRAVGLAGLVLLGTGLVHAVPGFEPYVPDEHTLHLWHLDESEPPFLDSGISPTSLLGLFNGATPSMESMEGFGKAISFEYEPGKDSNPSLPYGPILLAKPFLESGDADNVDPPFPIMGEDGAFTIEALVKLTTLPQDSPGFAADIVTMDEDSLANRVFLFRIEKPGFLSFVPISGNAVRGGGLATIPTTGPHAINTEDWFHVAVTYNGDETVPDNLKLYWTRVTPGLESANLIGRGTLSEDLSRQLGDFAIGNSGKFNALGPFEFFPGLIDEVRISSIARHPHDFFFVSPEAKGKAEEILSANPENAPNPELFLSGLFVNDQAVPIPQAGKSLILGPGMHRLDFDFGFQQGLSVDPFAVRCRLDGVDDEWHPTARGMSFTWEMLGEQDELLARRSFSYTRSSHGWEVDILGSPLVSRAEPIYVPENTRRIRATMSSGTPDTTGSWVIDNLKLVRSGDPGSNLWENGDFSSGQRLDQIGGVPSGWTRKGTEPAIARLMSPQSVGLALLDAEQEHSAHWTCTQELKVKPAKGGETFMLSWEESYNVIPGASLRASYLNVPSGEYTFRAMAVVDSVAARTTQLALPVVIHQPYWKQAWFLPLVVSGAVGLISWGLFLNYQRRARNRLAAIKMANAVERDRARIARDMHDDLGTRVSLMKHAASVVRQAIDGDPARARRQAARLESAATDLVWAMDGLVWAVNPSNDTLDHLAGHLSSVAQEIFRDASVRLRISIPTDLPSAILSSDFRHHFSLAVKEILHNILKHAGPCEVSLHLLLEGSDLIATVTDSGQGFDTQNPDAGNGLLNLTARAREIHGTCSVESSPGKGTRVILRCPLPKLPLNSRS